MALLVNKHLTFPEGRKLQGQLVRRGQEIWTARFQRSSCPSVKARDILPESIPKLVSLPTRSNHYFPVRWSTKRTAHGMRQAWSLRHVSPHKELSCYGLSQRMRRSNATGQVGTAQGRELKQSSSVCHSSKRTRKLRLTWFFCFCIFVLFFEFLK